MSLWALRRTSAMAFVGMKRQRRGCTGKCSRTPPQKTLAAGRLRGPRSFDPQKDEAPHTTLAIAVKLCLTHAQVAVSLLTHSLSFISQHTHTRFRRSQLRWLPAARQPWRVGGCWGTFLSNSSCAWRVASDLTHTNVIHKLTGRSSTNSWLLCFPALYMPCQMHSVKRTSDVRSRKGCRAGACPCMQPRTHPFALGGSMALKGLQLSPGIKPAPGESLPSRSLALEEMHSG